MNHPIPPHWICWYGDWKLTSLHAMGDFGTFFAYFLISVVAVYIYTRGKLSNISSSYPLLWRLGAAFVWFCALSHIGSFVEIWIGGVVYWITGANKIILASVSLWFAGVFWRNREQIVLAGQLLNRYEEASRDNDNNDNNENSGGNNGKSLRGL